MAICLAHDVASYGWSHGFATFLCSMDAAGAFDSIPHPVIFHKTMDVLPDNEWMLLVYWYSKLKEYTKWNNQISSEIFIQKGTRQGGLSSPKIFNMVYKDLIELLSNCNQGITIKGMHFNVYCYADDILLSSTSSIGLQTLIDKANAYMTQLSLIHRKHHV